MPVEVFQYTPERRSVVEPMLVALGQGQGNAAADAFFEELLVAPERRHEAVFVARDDERVVSLCLIPDRPMFGGTGRLAMPFVAPDNTDALPQLAPLMLNAAAAYLRKIGAPRLGVMAGDANPALQSAMLGFGLDPVMPYHRLKWTGDGTPVPVNRVEGVEYSVYRGGDAKTNEGIAKIWKSAFRADPIEPVLTPDVLEKAAERGDIWFLVARETATGRVVGVTEAGPGSYFSGIAVARSHWGKSLADALVLTTCNEFMAQGVNELNSMTRRNNAPSLKLQARLGWEVFEDGIFYATPSGED